MVPKWTRLDITYPRWAIEAKEAIASRFKEAWLKSMVPIDKCTKGDNNDPRIKKNTQEENCHNRTLYIHYIPLDIREQKL